jgi:hypothetical protein
MPPPISKKEIINLIVKSSLHLIMLRPSDKEPMNFGSGCIVLYKARYFLLSVAHVTNINDLATCIETNLQTVGLNIPLYSVGAMCYFDQYEFPKNTNPDEIKTFEDLKVDFDETLDISFCEIKEQITLLQQEWDFGVFKIESGEKIPLNLELAGNPEKGKSFGFCGKVKHGIEGIQLKSQPILQLDLEYQGTIGRFHYFTLPGLIKDEDDYSGCSGSPIIDENGKLIALTASVTRGTKLVFGFSIEECKKLLDLAINVNLL